MTRSRRRASHRRCASNRFRPPRRRSMSGSMATGIGLGSISSGRRAIGRCPLSSNTCGFPLVGSAGKADTATCLDDGRHPIGSRTITTCRRDLRVRHIHRIAPMMAPRIEGRDVERVCGDSERGRVSARAHPARGGGRLWRLEAATSSGGWKPTPLSGSGGGARRT
jgi:hypothetical protein